MLHGLPTIGGRGWIFNGMSTDSYLIDYQRKEECYSHDMLDEIIRVEEGVHTLTVGRLLELARSHLGPQTELELARDVAEKLVCPKCGDVEFLFTSLGKVPAGLASCPVCSDARRDVSTFYKIRGTEPFLEYTLAQIGVPAYDIVIARAKEQALGLELSADARAVLGPLASDEDTTEWL